MKDKVNKNKKQNIKDVNTEQNAIYSDPKDAANMQTVPQPKELPFSVQYLAIYDGYTNCENSCQDKRRGQLV